MFDELPVKKQKFSDLSEAVNIRTARNKLLIWYDAEKRDLPWRNTDDPYRVWLSEIMLQQTQVDTVIGYYRRFLENFPTVTALADASEDAVLKQWEGLGYYSRARHLHAAAKIVAANGGTFPDTAAAWRELPGIGAYTSAAIASIVNGEPVAAIDANLKRVFSRLLLADPNDKDGAQRIRSIGDAFTRCNRPGDVNQAFMDLGSAICRTRGEILCDACPLQEYCLAYREQKQAFFPPAKAKNAKKTEQYIVLVMRQGLAYAVEKRPARGMLAGLWQFPLLSIPEECDLTSLTKDDTPADDLDALRHRLQSAVDQYLHDTGLAATSLSFGKIYRHIYSHKIWQLLPCFVTVSADLTAQDSSKISKSMAWRTADQIKEELALIGACAPLADTILRDR